MCPFCLLHGKEEVFYAKGMERKPLCSEPGCKDKHVQWLHEVLSTKSASRKLIEPEEERAVTVTMGRIEWGLQTPDESWLDK
jgi:hypothetical protein